MSSEFGRTLRVGVFGQSHGAAIGVTIDGLPAGERIDLAELQAFLDRRKPGKSPLSTARKEADAPEFLSGLRDGVTCGSPLCAVIYNSNQHSSDYAELADKPRPSARGLYRVGQMGRAGGYARRRAFFRPLDGAAVHRRRHRQADPGAARRICRRAPCRRGSGGRRGIPALPDRRAVPRRGGEAVPDHFRRGGRADAASYFVGA